MTTLTAAIALVVAELPLLFRAPLLVSLGTLAAAIWCVVGVLLIKDRQKTEGAR